MHWQQRRYYRGSIAGVGTFGSTSGADAFFAKEIGLTDQQLTDSCRQFEMLIVILDLQRRTSFSCLCSKPTIIGLEKYHGTAVLVLLWE